MGSLNQFYRVVSKLLRLESPKMWEVPTLTLVSVHNFFTRSGCSGSTYIAGTIPGGGGGESSWRVRVEGAVAKAATASVLRIGKSSHLRGEVTVLRMGNGALDYAKHDLFTM